MSHLLLDSFDILPPRDHQGCGGVTGDMLPDASSSTIPFSVFREFDSWQFFVRGLVDSPSLGA